MQKADFFHPYLRILSNLCSELIMSYRKLTILDRISKRHSRPLDFPLGASRLPSRAAPRISLSRASRLPSRAPRDFPLARLATRVGLSNRGSKSEWAHGGSASWWGGWRLARRGGPRRLPLGGASGRRATTVRAPLPVGYLPTTGAHANIKSSLPRGSKRQRLPVVILPP